MFVGKLAVEVPLRDDDARQRLRLDDCFEVVLERGSQRALVRVVD